MGELMTKETFGLFAAVGLVAILGLKMLRKSPAVVSNVIAGSQSYGKTDPYSPANFAIIQEMPAVSNTAITEAAYHQGSGEFVPALGPDENQSGLGQEVLFPL
jgi:hypothetical protein